MPTDHRITDARKRAFVEALAMTGVVQEAADAAGVHRRTYLNWKDDDEEFAEACADAFSAAADRIRTEARLRAIEGVEEPVLVKGEPVFLRDPMTGGVLLDDDFEPRLLTRRVKSDRIFEKMMGALPEYKDKSLTIGEGGGGGGPRRVIVEYVDGPGEDADPEELLRRRQAARGE